MRKSGILLPISSLPSRYGIGCFSREAYEWIDFLKEAGQSYWQILPLGPTGYGDSPYQSFSTFAGNPYFISLDKLISYGWLTEEECDGTGLEVECENTGFEEECGNTGLAKECGSTGFEAGCKNTGSEKECDGTGAEEEDRYIDYGALYEKRYGLLKKAYDRSRIWENEDFRKFQQEEQDWLDNYALFMALKDEHGGEPWTQWEDALKYREEQALQEKFQELAEEIGYYKFLQFEFYREWLEVKEYANSQGIEIIGDIPIYVSMDSAEAWSGKELFQVDGQGQPLAVAGCPPDGFSAVGQLWGNPLYDWDYHRSTGFAWWMRRLKFCFRMYDVVRIDHFRGFDEYFAIPYGAVDARGGQWKKGPGIGFFEKVQEVFGKREIIAEDLGYVTDSVRKLVFDSGYPGMKVLEFAFDSRDSGSAEDYLPHNYDKNSVVYTGTHDNETVTGWFCEGLKEEEKQMVREYLCQDCRPDEEMYLPMVYAAMASVSRLCVIPLQDWLGYDNRARMNVPSTTGTNWRWRVRKEELTDELKEMIYAAVKRYGRLPAKAE